MEALNNISALADLGIAGLSVVVMAFFIFYLLRELRQVMERHRDDLERYRQEDQAEREQTRRVLEHLATVIQHINK